MFEKKDELGHEKSAPVLKQAQRTLFLLYCMPICFHAYGTVAVGALLETEKNPDNVWVFR